MKQKLSVTLDEELVQEIVRLRSTGKFRNKSHIVEFAVKKLLETDSSSKKKLPPPSPLTHRDDQDG
tara:strand:+ start:265 stop:462 length:198 start_codon:yes stop_codon:yes gene_type:complete